MNTYINPEAIENKSITKDKLSDDLIFDIKGEIPNNEIWYISNDGEVVIPYKNDEFGANIVSNTYENGKGIIKFNGDVTSIGYWAFYDRNSLTSVTIPNSVTSIGQQAFYYCWSLVDINIPDSVTSIGLGAFLDTSLTSVTIGNNVTSIGEIAFAYCSLLTNINIKNRVPISIGSDAFNDLSENFKICIPAGTLQSYISATNWSNYAEHMYECVFEDENLVSGQNIKTINGESILGNGDIVISIKEYTYSQLIELKNSNGLNPGAKYKLLDYVSDSSLCPILTALTSNSFDRKATAVDENGDSYDIEFNIDKISGNLTIDHNETGILLTGDQDPYAIDHDNEQYGIIKTGSEDELGLVISPIISDSYSSLPLGDILKTKTEQMYVYAINTIAGDPYWNFTTTDYDYNYSTIIGNTDTGEGCLKVSVNLDAGSEHNLCVDFYDENNNLIKSYYTSDVYGYGEIASFENIFGIDGLVLNAIINEVDEDPEVYYIYSYELKYNNTVIYQGESSSLEVDPESGYRHIFNIPNSMIFYELNDGNQGDAGENFSVYICSKTPLRSTSFKTFDQEFNICIKITHRNNDGEEFSYYVPIYKCINSYYNEDQDVSYYTEFSKEPARKISNVTNRIYLNSDESLKGTITYMKDKNGNIAPIDFINVTIDESPIFSDLQNSYNNQVEGVLETDDIWNYPYIRFEGRVRNNKISAGTSNILVKSSYNFVGNGISNQVINSNGMTILNGLTYIE